MKTTPLYIFGTLVLLLLATIAGELGHLAPPTSPPSALVGLAADPGNKPIGNADSALSPEQRLHVDPPALKAAAAAGAAPPPNTNPTPPALSEDMVHQALTNHPEWVMQAYQLDQQRQQEARFANSNAEISKHRTDLYSKAGDPQEGNPQGDMIVAEFFDYQCPYCKQQGPELEKLIATDSHVRVIYKEFPIFGGGSLTAAKAALASAAQGKYSAFHKAMLADRTPEHQLDDARVFAVAKDAGLDVDRLKVDMSAPNVTAQLEENRQLAATLGINSTPGLIVADRLQPGATQFEQLANQIAAARQGQQTHQ